MSKKPLFLFLALLMSTNASLAMRFVPNLKNIFSFNRHKPNTDASSTIDDEVKAAFADLKRHDGVGDVYKVFGSLEQYNDSSDRDKDSYLDGLFEFQQGKDAYPILFGEYQGRRKEQTRKDEVLAKKLQLEIDFDQQNENALRPNEKNAIHREATLILILILPT